MAIEIYVNDTAINYPQAGDPAWADDATNFAIQTASAFGQLGLSEGTTVDISGTLDVTGATTLDSTLTVAGTANLNGNNNLGNASGDTTAITGILNVDSGVLYVDPTNSRVGINDTTPSQALDVTGNVAITGNETVGGTLNVTGATTLSDTLGVTGDITTSVIKASGSGGLTIDSNGGTDVALFGAGGGAGTTFYGGLNGTTGNFADTTDATTSTDGALKTAGGVGIAKKLFVGTDATLGGVLYLDDSTTANTPVLSFTGDTNTGIGRSAADTLDFITNGNSRFRIESTGQIKAVYESQVGTDYNTQLDNGYLCRAWVNFNGTATQRTGTYTISGTTITVNITSHGLSTGNFAQLDFASGDGVDGRYSVTVINANSYTITNPVSGSTGGNVTQDAMIRASGNVSSITDRGTGLYTVNLTTAMPDTNYCGLANALDLNNAALTNRTASFSTVNSSSGYINSFATSTGGVLDCDNINAVVFR